VFDVRATYKMEKYGLKEPPKQGVT
jgi:hypothetical protein